MPETKFEPLDLDSMKRRLSMLGHFWTYDEKLRLIAELQEAREELARLEPVRQLSGDEVLDMTKQLAE